MSLNTRERRPATGAVPNDQQAGRIESQGSTVVANAMTCPIACSSSERCTNRCPALVADVIPAVLDDLARRCSGGDL